MAIFTNRATISWGDMIRDSNIVTGELLEVLSVTKNAARTTYVQGDTVTYIVSILNSGTGAFTGLSVTDDLGAYTVGNPAVTAVPLTYEAGSAQLYINGVLQTAPDVTADGGVLTFTGINIPANSNALLVYEAQVNAFAPMNPEASIVNTAVVSGGGLTAEISDSAEITAALEASLTISKALCPETVVDNGQITYTFVIQNTGNAPAVATDDVVLRDIFDPILDPITVTYNGAAVSSPAFYTYDAQTGEFVTSPGAVTVPAATFTQDPTTGVITVTPGTAVVRVTGTV